MAEILINRNTVSAKYCGEIPPVENGVIYNVTAVTYGGEVWYECNLGFMLSLAEPLRCELLGDGVAWMTASGDPIMCYGEILSDPVTHQT